LEEKLKKTARDRPRKCMRCLKKGRRQRDNGKRGFLVVRMK
jgi:hypothetical protein